MFFFYLYHYFPYETQNRKLWSVFKTLKIIFLALLFMLYFSDNCLTPPFFPFGTNHHHLSLFQICLYFWVYMHIWVFCLCLHPRSNQRSSNHWTTRPWCFRERPRSTVTPTETCCCALWTMSRWVPSFIPSPLGPLGLLSPTSSYLVGNCYPMDLLHTAGNRGLHMTFYLSVTCVWFYFIFFLQNRSRPFSYVLLV